MNNFEGNLEINYRNFLLASDLCTKDCGPGGTCLKETLMPEDDEVCRCNKGFNKTEDGKCVGGCSLIKHNLSGGSKKFLMQVLYLPFSLKPLIPGLQNSNKQVTNTVFGLNRLKLRAICKAFAKNLTRELASKSDTIRRKRY